MTCNVSQMATGSLNSGPKSAKPIKPSHVDWAKLLCKKRKTSWQQISVQVKVCKLLEKGGGPADLAKAPLI